jgi:thermostable 8-oxoguanine DNA glycosylase
MESNEAAWRVLLDAGLLEPGRRPSEREIEVLLRQPMEVCERIQRYRFPAAKARILAGALAAIEDFPPEIGNARGFRDVLMRIKGIGPKTASWVVRNWLGADDVAIIDVHVHRVGLYLGLFQGEWKLPRDYCRMEERFLAFAKALGIRASLLDATIWREARIMHGWFEAAR